MGAASEVVKNTFGFDTTYRVNPITDTVGTTATQILKNNPDRVMILIINLSANTGYVGFSNDVSTDKGIILDSNGGIVSLTVKEDGELVTNNFYGVNVTAAGKWYIVEVFKA